MVDSIELSYDGRFQFFHVLHNFLFNRPKVQSARRHFIKIVRYHRKEWKY